MTAIKKCLDNPGWYLVIYIKASHSQFFSLPWALDAGKGTLRSNCPQYPQFPKRLEEFWEIPVRILAMTEAQVPQPKYTIAR